VISYAQNREDVVLARALNRPAGFYIDVGAASPVLNSVTKHFYDCGWRGINVEPLELWQRQLAAERPRDVNLQVGLGEEEGRLEFFDVSADATEESTFSAEVAEALRARGLEPEVREVPVTTLAAVCEEHVRGPIDFLKIDVEGFELPVLRGAEFERFRPSIVVVENTRPGTSEPTAPGVTELMQAAGYVPALFDGVNCFYVEEDDDELRSRLRAPANVLDDFEDRAVAELRATVAALDAARERELAEAVRQAEDARRHIAWLDARVREVEEGAAAAERRAEILRERLRQAEQDVVTARSEAADAELQFHATREALQRAVDG
jgi:FkbM family methyltransferase